MLYSLGYFVARNADFLTNGKTGDACEHKVFIFIDTTNCYVGYRVFLDCTNILDVWIDYLVLAGYDQEWYTEVYECKEKSVSKHGYLLLTIVRGFYKPFSTCSSVMPKRRCLVLKYSMAFISSFSSKSGQYIGVKYNSEYAICQSM